MKNILIVFVILSLSCTRDCPDCTNYPSPLKFSVLNSEGENLLDPNSANTLEIEKITFNSVNTMSYILSAQDNYSVQITDTRYPQNCIGQDGMFCVIYKNSIETDTLNVLIDEIVTEVEKDCNCVSYQIRYIKHNGVAITEYNYDVAILRK